MKSNCAECWDLAKKFHADGDEEMATKAALVGHQLNSLQREPRIVEHDHEGSMARSELTSLKENAAALCDMIGKDDELPGWVSAYITLASDYMDSVAQYLKQQDEDDEH